MEKMVYRGLLIAVCAVGILLGLQYFLPITAQYFGIKDVAGIPGLPSMPTIAYQDTVAPLPLVTLEITPSTAESFFIIETASPISGAAAAGTLTPTPGATEITASATLASGVTASLTPAPGATAIRQRHPPAKHNTAAFVYTIPIPSATPMRGSVQ